MITGDRDEFVGFHVTFEVKEALRVAAATAGKSMSQFCAEAAEKEIRAMGVPITLEVVDKGPRLPFEIIHEFTCQTNPGSRGYVKNSSCNCGAEGPRLPFEEGQTV